MAVAAPTAAPPSSALLVEAATKPQKPQRKHGRGLPPKVRTEMDVEEQAQPR